MAPKKKTFSSPRKSREPSDTILSEEKEDRRRLGKLIKVLTTTGLDTLELKYFEEMKCLCLKSDDLIQFAYKNLFENLHKDHSQIRLSSLQICDQLLRCSKVFRSQLIADLPEIFPLVLQDSSFRQLSFTCRELPPPKEKADLLCHTAMLMIKQWYDLYGLKPKYFRLRLGHRYVCTLYHNQTGSSLYDVETFTPPTASSVHLPLTLPLSNSQTNDVIADEINVFTSQLDDCLAEMTTAISSLDSCLHLLLPSPDEFNLNETEAKEHENDKTDVKRDQIDNEKSVRNETKKQSLNENQLENHFPLISHHHSKDQSEEKSARVSNLEDISKSSRSRDLLKFSLKEKSSKSSRSKNSTLKPSSSRVSFSKSSSFKDVSSKSSSSKDGSSKFSSSKDSTSKFTCSLKDCSSKSSSPKDSFFESCGSKNHSSKSGSLTESSSKSSITKDSSSKSGRSKDSSSKSSSSEDGSSKSSSSKDRSSKYSSSQDSSSKSSSSKERSLKSSISKDSSSKSSSSRDHSSKSSSTKDGSSKSSSSKDISSKSSSSRDNASKSSCSKDSFSKSSSSKDGSSKFSNIKESFSKSSSSSKDGFSKSSKSKHHSSKSSSSKGGSLKSSSKDNYSKSSGNSKENSSNPSKDTASKFKSNHQSRSHSRSRSSTSSNSYKNFSETSKEKTSISGHSHKDCSSSSKDSSKSSQPKVPTEVFGLTKQNEGTVANKLHKLDISNELKNMEEPNTKTESSVVSCKSNVNNSEEVINEPKDLIENKEVRGKILEASLEMSENETMGLQTITELAKSTKRVMSNQEDNKDMHGKEMEINKENETVQSKLMKLETIGELTKAIGKDNDDLNEKLIKTIKNSEFTQNDPMEVDTNNKLAERNETFDESEITEVTKDEDKVNDEDVNDIDKFNDMHQDKGNDINKDKANDNVVNDNDEDSVNDDDDDEEEDTEEEAELNRQDEPGEYLREMGVLFNTNITIILPSDKIEISETVDNSAILENARGSYTLMQKKYLPLLHKWHGRVHKSKYKCSDQIKSALQRYSKMRSRALSLVEKYEKIRVLPRDPEVTSGKFDENQAGAIDGSEGDSDDFEDMEEVACEEAELLPILRGTEEARVEDATAREKTDNAEKSLRQERWREQCKRKRETEEEWSLRVSEMERVDPSSGYHHKRLIAAQRNATASNASQPPARLNCATDASSSHQSLAKLKPGCSNEALDSSPQKAEAGEEAPTSVYGAFSERKRKLLALAPRLPYDTDLYHWEDEALPVPRLLPNSTEGHRFWSASALDEGGEGIPVPGGSALYRTRVIEFSGQDTAAQDRPCRAPLPSGKLCPRRDKLKCPFHGVIFARDEQGRCLDPEEEARWRRTEEERRRQQVPDWQDPALLRQLKAATGVDLTMPRKGQRRRVAPGPGLIKLVKAEATPAGRIKKKIFRKSSMRRVARALNKIDERKFRDKFGDQFNYS